jgi:quercetin dioxygenase-like cupin family protein
VFVARRDAPEREWQTLRIREYITGQGDSASIAAVEVPPGGFHPPAYSTRSDKYYLALEGRVRFQLLGELRDLEQGDLVIVRKGQAFSYANVETGTALLLLVHVPSFDASAEVVTPE